MSDAAAPTESAPSLARRILPKLLLSLVLGALFAWLVSRGGVPLVPPAHAFARLTWWAVPLYALLVVASNFVRATRWRHLIEPVKKVSVRESVLVNWVGFFAIFALPLRLGELARPALSRIRQGIPISAGLGTIAVERVVDGLITSLFVAWAVFALPHLDTHDPLARSVPAYGTVLLVVFVCAFLALGLFLWQRALATRLVEAVFGIVSKKLATRLASRIGSIADGLRSIASPRLAALFLGESAVYWLLNAVGMWLLAVGVGLPMTLGQAFAVMGVLAIGILLPAGPGLFGNFQLAVIAALKLYFPESVVGEVGAAYVFLMYVTQALFFVVSGVIPLLGMNVRLSQLLDVRPDDAHAEKLPAADGTG